MEQEIESSFSSQNGGGNKDNKNGFFLHFSSFAIL